jgi:hypothetical protein
VKNYLSEDGFGLIQVLAVLVIVTIAISGLFITTMYARSKSIENYHYRAALLYASSKIELIKYYNRYNKGKVIFTGIEGVSTIPSSFVLDKRDGKEPLIAKIRLVYDIIKIEITWKEGGLSFLSSNQNITRTLMLREDYFRRTN